MRCIEESAQVTQLAAADSAMRAAQEGRRIIQGDASEAGKGRHVIVLVLFVQTTRLWRRGVEQRRQVRSMSSFQPRTLGFPFP